MTFRAFTLHLFYFELFIFRGSAVLIIYFLEFFIVKFMHISNYSIEL